MDPSFKGASVFCYRRGGEEAVGEPEVEVCPGLLDVYVHHARNIHNICIYANQDVYAKFSLTCSPDNAISTRIVAGGGKNPQFDESLTIKVPHADAVLKCEIWMLSRARNYLEDQLLGFALVPLSWVAAEARGKLTQDFTLSSTDLFHSPAGTVQLTLTLHTSSDKHAFAAESPSTPNTSITSEVIILDPAEFGRIEFPDISITRENQQMVSEYYDMTAAGHPCPPRAPAASFLQLGASSQSMEDYEMAANSSDDNNGGSDSPDGSIQNSGPFTSSTTTSLSDDRNSANSMEKKNRQGRTSNNSNVENNRSGGTNSPGTPTSKCRGGVGDGKDENKLSSKEEAEAEGGGKEHEMGSVFKSPLGNIINLEAEQNVMQQQIVDMYMRSMQQFTESLAKMKLPMDLDAPKAEDGGDVIQSQKTDDKLEKQKKKDGARVFYGSRAFF